MKTQEAFLMKKSKLGVILTALVMAVIGTVLVLFPGQALITILRIVGVGLILIGGIGVVGYFVQKDPEKKSIWKMLVSAAEAVIGVVILANPALVISIYPVIMGIVIILDGLSNVLSAISMKQHGISAWKYSIVLSLITIALGVIILCNPFSTVSALISIIGVVLIYDAISNILIALKR